MSAGDGARRAPGGTREAAGRIGLLFLIRALDYGGAERQLIELARALDHARFAVTVATYYDGGGLRHELEASPEVRVVSLGKRGRWEVVPFVYRLLRAVRAARPQIVCGQMDLANELALLAGRVVGARVVWGLRASNMDLARYNWLSRAFFRIGARLSRCPDAIIVNSHAGAAHYRANGYAGRRMIVIPNGVDTARFRPERAAGDAPRRAWGVPPDDHLIGLVGRLDPMKDHPTFLRAAARLAADWPRARFVCVGDGPADYRERLRAQADGLGLGGRLTWAGSSGQMPALYNALDIATSSSAYGEGTSNVVAEAMACGVPCVVTDVGDSARVVGAAGLVVPPGEPAALATAWAALLADAPRRAALGAAARLRVEEEYSLRRLARATEATLLGVLR